MHLFRSLTSIFTHILHLLIHGGKRLHASTNGESETSDSTYGRNSSTLYLVKEVGSAVQKRLFGSPLKAYSFQLRPERLRLCLQLIKSLGTTRRLTQLLIHNLDRILQVTDIGGREISQRIIHQLCFSFNLLHVLSSTLDLLVVFINLMDYLLLLSIDLLQAGLHLVQLLDGVIIRRRLRARLCHLFFQISLRLGQLVYRCPLQISHHSRKILDIVMQTFGLCSRLAETILQFLDALLQREDILLILLPFRTVRQHLTRLPLQFADGFLQLLQGHVIDIIEDTLNTLDLTLPPVEFAGSLLQIGFIKEPASLSGILLSLLQILNLILQLLQTIHRLLGVEFNRGNIPFVLCHKNKLSINFLQRYKSHENHKNTSLINFVLSIY